MPRALSLYPGNWRASISHSEAPIIAGSVVISAYIIGGPLLKSKK